MGRTEKNTSELIYDICIVGAGVAGSILAANLVKLFNYRIIVIEKNLKTQDRISGELLQPGGVQALKKMQLDFLLDKIDAQKVEGYTLFLKEESVSIPYMPKERKTNNGTIIDREKTITAFSFKNSSFVNQARKFIQDFDHLDLVDGNVMRIVEQNNIVEGVEYYSQKNRKKYTVKSKLTIICEGQISKLRNQAAKSIKKINGYFVGLILEKCELPIPNYGHVILTGESPILIYPISSTEKRILIDFPGNRPPKLNDEFKNFLIDKVKNHLPKEFHQAFNAAVKKGKFRSMPNQNLKSTPLNKKRVVLLGDSFNMRHPLTGGGMSAVFNDINNILKNFKKNTNLSNEKETDKIIKNYYKKRNKDVSNINILADSLYHATIDPELKLASFNYLKKESCQQETIQIIAGIDKKKFNLIQHFISVTLHGINKLDLTHVEKLNLLVKASRTIIPLLVQEGDSRFHRWGEKLIQKFFIPKLAKKSNTSNLNGKKKIN